MLGALLTFVVLFALVKLFERKRDDLDNFSIATVAIIPVLSVIAARVIIGLLFPDPILTVVLPAAVLIGATFFLLWKHLEIPVGRSVTYTVVVLLANEGIVYLLLATQS